MQKLIDSIPLILLMVLLPYLYYNQPNIAQSIMLASIVLLVGYKSHLESLKKPDHLKIFTKRLDESDLESNRKADILLKEVEELKAVQGKLNIVRSTEEKIKNFKW